jgi:hypothetical protein
MPRLGEILLTTKILTETELDSALENHVLHGVKLGTCLVEMGYVSDEVLAKCLGRQTGHRFLNKDQLLAAGSRHLSVITPADIKKQRLVPVGTSGNSMLVATDDYTSDRKQVEVEMIIGRKVELVAVTGYAMDCFLEQLFGVPRPGRFLPKFALHGRQAASAPPPSSTKPDQDSVVIDGIEWKSLSDVTADEPPIDTETAESSAHLDVYTARHTNVPERLVKALSRDDVANIIMDFVSEYTDCAALFIIKDNTVRGWHAVSNGKKVQGFDSISSPLSALPDMNLCVTRKSCSHDSGQNPETADLLRLLNCCGKEGVYFPVFVQQKVVAVLFCLATSSLNRDPIMELCQKTSYALEMLILRSKILS